MDVFTTGLVVLFVASAVFYIAIFSFMFYWHLRKLTFVVVPIIFTFEFFATGFFIVCIVSIIFNYVPYLLG